MACLLRQVRSSSSCCLWANTWGLTSNMWERVWKDYSRNYAGCIRSWIRTTASQYLKATHLSTTPSWTCSGLKNVTGSSCSSAMQTAWITLLKNYTNCTINGWPTYTWSLACTLDWSSRSVSIWEENWTAATRETGPSWQKRWQWPSGSSANTISTIRIGATPTANYKASPCSKPYLEVSPKIVKISKKWS